MVCTAGVLLASTAKEPASGAEIKQQKGLVRILYWPNTLPPDSVAQHRSEYYPGSPFWSHLSNAELADASLKVEYSYFVLPRYQDIRVKLKLVQLLH